MTRRRLVWFVVIDANGVMCKGTSAGSVCIASSCVVDQFCQRLVTAFPDVLGARGPTQLAIYADKAAWVAHMPLRPQEPIGTTRGTKKAKLLVKLLSWPERCSISREVETKTWRSVVRLSCDPSFGATGLVVDRTRSHVYLLTSLHVWLHDGIYASGRFFNAMNAQFREEMTKLAPRCSTRKRKLRDDLAGTNPEIQVEQWTVEDLEVLLQGVLRFDLAPEICWRSCALHDFAIFQLALPEDDDAQLFADQAVVLPRLEIQTVAMACTMKVHVFGFPSDGCALTRSPLWSTAMAGEISAWNPSQMAISALAASSSAGSVIVCTKRQTPLGFLCQEMDNDGTQCQWYGHTFRVLPNDLPSRAAGAIRPDT